MSKSKTHTYESHYDIFKYPNNERTFLDTVTTNTESKNNFANIVTTLTKVEVKLNRKTSGFCKEAYKEPTVTIEEDGWGAKITLPPGEGKTGQATTSEIYLHYGQLHDLSLALQRYHEEQKYGIFRKVPKSKKGKKS